MHCLRRPGSNRKTKINTSWEVVHACFKGVSNVLGSKFGKRRMARGSKASANGMMMNRLKGITLMISADVRVSCLRSLRDR
jgi:hypothetical protein